MIALDQRLQGNTLHGADHYHADYVSPDWAERMTTVATIGKHIFYRA